MDVQLKMKFHRAMLNIYHTAKKELGYNANRFMQMLTTPDESVRTAKKFVLSNSASDGFSELWSRGRLDLTVEALVGYNDESAVLFSDDEREAARQRLTDLGYHHN